MKTEEISAFLTVAREGSFSRAAEKLYISQPTVSRYVANLENELAMPLLVRHARTCELTEFGDKIIHRLRRIHYEMEKIASEAEMMHQDGEKTLRIGYTYEGILPFITNALDRSEIDFFDKDIKLCFDCGELLISMLRAEKLDCVLMHFPSLASPEGLDIQLIQKTKMGIIVAENHPLAEQEKVHLKQLCGETQLRYHKERNFYEIADDVFLKVGLEPMKYINIDSQQQGILPVRSKGCVMLNPIVYPSWAGCRTIEIEDWSADSSLIALTRRESSSFVLQAFIKAIRNEFRNVEK